jgi:S-formylglutathione hydrolase FrmB
VAVTLSRRALLAGAVGVGAVSATGAVPGVPALRHHLDRLVHPVPEPSYTLPSRDASIVSGTFVSQARGGRSVGWSIAYPPGARRDLAVAVVLHGRGDNHGTVFASHAWGRYLLAEVEAGVPAFAVAAADGGDHGYWHRRADGDDPQLMLLSEFVPLLARRGLRTHQFGLAGWSMGGYGALLLAERIGRARCAVVAVDSPALWPKSADTAPGAFDNAADYAAHDVLTNATKLRGIPLRVAIGTSDPFYATTRSFVSELSPRPRTDFSRGGHDLAFWRHSAPQQIAFLGAHLRGV